MNATTTSLYLLENKSGYKFLDNAVKIFSKTILISGNMPIYGNGGLQSYSLYFLQILNPILSLSALLFLLFLSNLTAYLPLYGEVTMHIKIKLQARLSLIEILKRFLCTNLKKIEQILTTLSLLL